MKKQWTFDNIPDLTGKKIIVTGGNSGLGFECVKAFSAKGANVVLAARSKEKADVAKKEILSVFPKSKIELRILDLADLKSIHEFVKAYKKDNKKLDVLLNNAGVMMTPYLKTKDGFELQFGTNHLGHFALTGLLLDILKQTPKSRVITTSSTGHRFGKMDFENLMFEKGGYTPLRAYGRSKLANLLFTYELQRRFDNYKIDSISVAAHPGGANTNLGRHVEGKFSYKILLALGNLQTAAMGAMPIIRASTDPDIKGGEYYGPGGFFHIKGYPVKVKSNKKSHGKENAKKLWEISESLTKIKYNF